MLAVSAATCQVLSTGSPVDDSHRLASYDTSLVVSGGVDCGRRRRNVYDKKSQRYAKDNRTAHLTARSDKSVTYVTRRSVLLELTTDRHAASRGLFATAELLVLRYTVDGLIVYCPKFNPLRSVHYLQQRQCIVHSTSIIAARCDA